MSTITSPIATEEVVVNAEADTKSYVDWAAIIAGIIMSSAISLLLLTFGSAVGLSFINFHNAEGVSPIWVAIAAASWLLWVEVSSFMAGAYLTGRLRRRHHDATEQESDVRDGAHGLLVWAGAVVVSGILAAGGIGAAVSAIGSIAGAATNAASNIAGGAAGAITADPNAYFVDQLLRPAAPAAGAAPAAPTAAPAPTDTTAVRAELGRVYAQVPTGGTVSDPDKAYLAQVVAQQTGMSPADAATRVDQVDTALAKARQDAADAAEAARKAGVVAAFLTAAALLVGAVGAFWAAQKGGNHRDSNTLFHDVFRRW